MKTETTGNFEKSLLVTTALGVLKRRLRYRQHHGFAGEVLAVTQPPEPPAALRKRATAGDACEHYERALARLPGQRRNAAFNLKP